MNAELHNLRTFNQKHAQSPGTHPQASKILTGGPADPFFNRTMTSKEAETPTQSESDTQFCTELPTPTYPNFLPRNWPTCPYTHSSFADQPISSFRDAARTPQIKFVEDTPLYLSAFQYFAGSIPMLALLGIVIWRFAEENQESNDPHSHYSGIKPLPQIRPLRLATITYLD